MGTDHESKQELDDWILRAANGDSSAYGPIVKRSERPLRAWVASHAPPGVDVDEVAQRAFIAAYTRLGEFEVGTNFSAWLFSIAE
jgi:RNA polymerase sigma-70 factor (ECF subfamily)